MGRTNVTNQRALGAAIIERFRAVTIPGTLKPHLRAFAAEHALYEAAAKKTDAARAVRDGALANVAFEDDKLDQAVGRLADQIIGAGGGTRRQPFARFSARSPSDIAGLAYANEVKEVRLVAAGATKANLGAVVTKAAAACVAGAGKVEAALKGLVRPQVNYEKARGERDARLPEWTRLLQRLKRHAWAAWDEDVATYRAVFAAPEAIVSPVKRRGKKAKAIPATAPANSNSNANANPNSNLPAPANGSGGAAERSPTQN